MGLLEAADGEEAADEEDAAEDEDEAPAEELDAVVDAAAEPGGGEDDEHEGEGGDEGKFGFWGGHRGVVKFGRGKGKREEGVFAGDYSH